MRNKKLIVLFVILSIVTLLIVLGSVIFSVQDVYGYCYNDSDDAFMREVATDEVTGIQKGKSIFLLNEQDVINSVESKIPDVEIINVERKFPNRIYINFVRIFPYLVFDVEGSETALLVANNGKITSKIDKQSEYDGYIRLISDMSANSTTVGEKVFVENSVEQNTILGIMKTMERIDLHSAVIDMFEFIDISKLSGEDGNGTLFIKTRTGAFIEIQKASENTANKLASALSVYKEGNKYQTEGTIIVDGANKITRSLDDRYQDSK